MALGSDREAGLKEQKEWKEFSFVNYDPSPLASLSLALTASC